MPNRCFFRCEADASFRIIKAFVLAALWLGASLASEPSPASARPNEEDTLTVGYLNSGGPWDSQVVAGIRRAIEEAGTGSDARRPRVKLLLLDPPHPWRDTGSQLARVLFENKMTVLIGPTQGQEAHVAVQIATRARIPVITLAGEDNLTQAVDPWIFRGIPSDSEQAEFLLSRVLNRSRTEEVAAVVPEGRSGRERTNALQKGGRDLGISLAFHTGTDEITTENHAAVLLWLDPDEAVRWIEQMQNHVHPELILGSLRLIHPKVIAATANSGFKLYVPYPGARSQSEKVEQENLWEALGFDMVGAIVQSAPSERPTSQDIRAALLKQNAIMGITGPFHFDARGNRRGSMSIAGIQNGRLTVCDDSK